MRIDRVEEFAISAQVFAQVRDLLQIAFPGCRKRGRKPLGLAGG
jgi:hypothetical protein